jgi:O-antigen/teichoic acid export membrane protein
MLGLALGQLIRAAGTAVALGVYNAVYLFQGGAGIVAMIDRSLCLSFVGVGVTGLAVRWIQGIQGGFDVVCVSTSQGPETAAKYANTSKPTGFATGFAMAFGGALLPSFTRFMAREQGPPSFRLFVNTLRLTVIMAGALAIGFVSVRRQFLTAWVGPQFILPWHLVFAIAAAGIANTSLAFASYMFGATGKLTHANAVLFGEGVCRLAMMAIGGYAYGGFGVAVGATPTPLIATALLIVAMGRHTGVRFGAAPWLALATDWLLIGVGLSAADRLPEFTSAVWQIPVVAAAVAGAAVLVLTMRSPPLREMLLHAAYSIVPARLRWADPAVDMKA